VEEKESERRKVSKVLKGKDKLGKDEPLKGWKKLRIRGSPCLVKKRSKKYGTVIKGSKEPLEARSCLRGGETPKSISNFIIDMGLLMERTLKTLSAEAG